MDLFLVSLQLLGVVELLVTDIAFHRRGPPVMNSKRTQLSPMRLSCTTRVLCVLLHLRDVPPSRVLIFAGQQSATQIRRTTNMRAMPDDERERPPINPRREEVKQQLAMLQTKAKALA